MMTKTLILLLITLAIFIAASSAWSSTPTQQRESSLKLNKRREFLTIIIGSTSGSLLILSNSPPANAAASSQEQKDKENIVKGYNRLQYLLNNWEDETTVCKTGQEVSSILDLFFTILQLCIYDSITNYIFKHGKIILYLATYRQPLVINVKDHQQR